MKNEFRSRDCEVLRSSLCIMADRDGAAAVNNGDMDVEAEICVLLSDPEGASLVAAKARVADNMLLERLGGLPRLTSVLRSQDRLN